MRLPLWSRRHTDVHIDVLVVCRANYTRSPFIAADLQRRVGERLAVGSAGTRALKPSQGVDRRVLPHVGDVGLDPAVMAEHEPRQLTEQMITSATLVIAATREVRGFIDSIAPGTTDRVYTLLELADLLREAPNAPGLGAAAVTELAASRRTNESLAEDGNDLADPRGEAPEAYRTMIQTVSAALDIIAPALVSAPDAHAAADLS